MKYIKYFNIKNNFRTETVDEIRPADYICFKKYKKEIQRLIQEYRLCGMNVYISQKPCKDWNNAE